MPWKLRPVLRISGRGWFQADRLNRAPDVGPSAYWPWGGGGRGRKAGRQDGGREHDRAEDEDREMKMKPRGTSPLDGVGEEVLRLVLVGCVRMGRSVAEVSEEQRAWCDSEDAAASCLEPTHFRSCSSPFGRGRGRRF